MHTTILMVHSWLRWVALVAGVAATIAALRDNTAPPAASRADRWGLILMATLDLQMLLGLVMYFTVTLPSMQGHMAEVMKDAGSRFFAVEHITMMMGAVILTHVGRVLARKSATADSKKMKLLICFGMATALMLLAIPWPGMRGGRPLFRGL
jgi:cytochrome c biogenesis factor